MIKIIACIDSEFGIGKNGKMPWPRLKGDMSYFYNKTFGRTIVIGRKTFEEIGELPNRQIIVYKGQLDEILKLAEQDNIWICGGQRVYEDFLPYAKEIHLTRILNKKYGCDTFFPYFNPLKESFIFNPVGFYAQNDIEYSIDVFKLI